MDSCSHYQRGCQLLAPCCNEFFSCRFCHDEVHYENQRDVKKQHKMDRHSVKVIKCKACGLEQSLNKECSGCNAVMGEYFCSKCALFDSGPKLDIYHCDKCGICRKGNSEEYFHCDNCNGCLHISMKDNHACREGAFSGNCAVCLDDIFTSRKACTPMRCGHFIHRSCLSYMVKNGQFRCPVCLKTVVDLDEEAMDKMIQENPMPEEYRDTKVKIHCLDCQANSTVNFHFIGHKCPSCNSYNTSKD